MTKEIWKDVKVYDKDYLVSNKGRVAKLCLCFLSSSPKRPDNSYVCFNCRGEGKQKKYKVHRLVAEAFLPNPKNRPQVNHIDGDKQNNCVDNLEWVTPSENIRHAFSFGLNHTGECHSKSKLTDAQRKEIMECYVPNDRKTGSRALAKKYGVSHNTILYIIKH